MSVTALSADELPSHRLAALGLVLPPVAAPLAAYVPAVAYGGLVWSSGQLPIIDGALRRTGLVTATPATDDASLVSPEEAAELARTCVLNAIAAIASVAGPAGIDAITRIVKVVGFVAGAPGFTGQPAVVDGASKPAGRGVRRRRTQCPQRRGGGRAAARITCRGRGRGRFEQRVTLSAYARVVECVSDHD